MAVKKLISSPSTTSSSSSSSEDDNDSSSDEERFVAQPAPSLKRKQQHSKEGEEKESEEDEEKTKSPATKSVSHPSQAHQSCTEQDKIKESVPHPSQQSSDQEEEEEEEDAKSPVENSESLVQSEKKLKPNFVPAKKQISSPSASSSSDDANDSSSDEEQFVAQPVPSLKRKQRNSKEREEKESEGDSSDEEEDEEKAKSPVRKCVSHLSQAQQSCTEEEKQKENTKESVPHLSQLEEEEEEEDAKLPVENSESLVQPQKKKLKPNSVPAGKSPSTATNSAVQRIWSVEDELVLLHALSHHHNTYGKVPSSKEYGSFLTTIIGSLSFLATEKQLGNKIRTWKTNYAQRKKMGSKPKPLNPHEIEVFKICAKLFEDVRNTKSVGGVAKGNSTIYLREVISRQKLPTWLSSVEDMVQQLGESRARDLEAMAKQLSIDEMKLNAREVKLMADLFDFIADGMAGDG